MPSKNTLSITRKDFDKAIRKLEKGSEKITKASLARELVRSQDALSNFFRSEFRCDFTKWITRKLPLRASKLPPISKSKLTELICSSIKKWADQNKDDSRFELNVTNVWRELAKLNPSRRYSRQKITRTYRNNKGLVSAIMTAIRKNHLSLVKRVDDCQSKPKKPTSKPAFGDEGNLLLCLGITIAYMLQTGHKFQNLPKWLQVRCAKNTGVDCPLVNGGGTELKTKLDYRAFDSIPKDATFVVTWEIPSNKSRKALMNKEKGLKDVISLKEFWDKNNMTGFVSQFFEDKKAIARHT
jgi:hypothetical protein